MPPGVSLLYHEDYLRARSSEIRRPENPVPGFTPSFSRLPHIVGELTQFFKNLRRFDGVVWVSRSLRVLPATPSDTSQQGQLLPRWFPQAADTQTEQPQWP